MKRLNRECGLYEKWWRSLLETLPVLMRIVAMNVIAVGMVRRKNNERAMLISSVSRRNYVGAQ